MTPIKEGSVISVSRTTCRACEADLIPVLSLGDLRLNAFPKTREELARIPTVPLNLMVCGGCSLIQLDRTVPPDLLYRHYYYRSGVNESMVEELHGIVRTAREMVQLDRGNAVLDIGANDGTLLAAYAGTGVYRVGVEPADNLQDVLASHAEHVIHGYFPFPPQVISFKIITAVACVYDTEDPGRFFQVIHDHLTPDGVAVIQFQDFEQQLQTSAFDNICHEHLLYYTLWSLTPLLRQSGLMVEHCHQTPINGGSLRLYLRHAGAGFHPQPSVAYQLLREAQATLDAPSIRGGTHSAFGRFRQQIARAQTRIAALLDVTLEQGAVVDIYGASTKGNILLQVLGVGPQEVRQAIDRSPQKAGLLTITGIPIVGEEEGRREPADVWLTPIWQFRESVLRRERWYVEQGGTIVFPLPTVEVVRRMPLGADERSGR